MPSHLTHLRNRLRALPNWSPRRQGIQHEIEQEEARLFCDEPEIDDELESRRRHDHFEATAAECGEARRRLFSGYSDKARSDLQHAKAAHETARRNLDDFPPAAA